MAQGLQVYDENGNLVIDTSTLVLKEYTSATVSSTSGANSVAATVPGNSTVVATSSNRASGSAEAPPAVEVNGSNIDYDFGGQGGTYDSEVKLVAF